MSAVDLEKTLDDLSKDPAYAKQVEKFRNNFGLHATGVREVPLEERTDRIHGVENSPKFDSSGKALSAPVVGPIDAPPPPPPPPGPPSPPPAPFNVNSAVSAAGGPQNLAAGSAVVPQPIGLNPEELSHYVPPPPAGGPAPGPVPQAGPLGVGGPAAPKGPAGPVDQEPIYHKYTPGEKQKTQGQFLGALEHEGEAKVGQSEAAATGHMHAADEMFKAVDEQQKVAQENANKEAARIKWSQDKLTQYEKMTDDLAAKKIDPNRWWSDASAAQLVTAGIGMIFGIFGAPATGGVNSGVTAIEKSISQDIDAQKANLASAHASAEKKRGLFADYMGVFQNERMAEAATSASLWQAAKTRIEAYNQIASGDIAINQGQEALAKVEQNWALAKDRFVQMALDAKTAEERAAANAQAQHFALLQKHRDDRIKLASEVAKENAAMYAKGGKAAQIAYTKNGMPYAADMDGNPVGDIPVKLKDGEAEAPIIVGINKETGEPEMGMGLAATKEHASTYGKLAYELAPAITATIKLKKLQEKYGNKGVSVFESAEEKDDRALAQSYAQTIRSVIKGPAFINAGAALSPGELKMLNEIATEDPLQSKKMTALGGAAIGGAVGFAAGGPTPLAPFTALGGAIAGGAVNYDANPIGKRYDAIADSLQQRLDTAAELNFTHLPPRSSGGSFNPLSFGKPTDKPVR